MSSLTSGRQKWMYKRVETTTSARRAFVVTCGLREGYGPAAREHNLAEAIEVALGWMKGKAAAGLPFLTGAFGLGEVVYAWPEGPGQAGGGHEPVAEFHGEVSPLYAADLADEEAMNLLNDLAAVLGAALGQTRVYVAYRDETWVLQAEKTATPTGETV